MMYNDEIEELRLKIRKVQDEWLDLELELMAHEKARAEIKLKVQKGLEQSARGETENLGDFSKYADDDIE